MNKKTTSVFLLVALISITCSAPLDSEEDPRVQQSPVVPSYGDEPPSENARDYWSSPSEQDQVQVQNPNSKKTEGDTDADAADENADDTTESYEDDGTDMADEGQLDVIIITKAKPEAPTKTKPLVVSRVKRNKRPIRYRAKSNKQ